MAETPTFGRDGEILYDQMTLAFYDVPAGMEH